MKQLFIVMSPKHNDSYGKCRNKNLLYIQAGCNVRFLSPQKAEESLLMASG